MPTIPPQAAEWTPNDPRWQELFAMWKRQAMQQQGLPDREPMRGTFSPPGTGGFAEEWRRPDQSSPSDNPPPFVPGVPGVTLPGMPDPNRFGHMLDDGTVVGGDVDLPQMRARVIAGRAMSQGMPEPVDDDPTGAKAHYAEMQRVLHPEQQPAVPDTPAALNAPQAPAVGAQAMTASFPAPNPQHELVARQKLAQLNGQTPQVFGNGMQPAGNGVPGGDEQQWLNTINATKGNPRFFGPGGLRPEMAQPFRAQRPKPEPELPGGIQDGSFREKYGFGGFDPGDMPGDAERNKAMGQIRTDAEPLEARQQQLEAVSSRIGDKTGLAATPYTGRDLDVYIGQLAKRVGGLAEAKRRIDSGEGFSSDIEREARTATDAFINRMHGIDSNVAQKLAIDARSQALQRMGWQRAFRQNPMAAEDWANMLQGGGAGGDRDERNVQRFMAMSQQAADQGNKERAMYFAQLAEMAGQRSAKKQENDVRREDVKMRGNELAMQHWQEQRKDYANYRAKYFMDNPKALPEEFEAAAAKAGVVDPGPPPGSPQSPSTPPQQPQKTPPNSAAAAWEQEQVIKLKKAAAGGDEEVRSMLNDTDFLMKLYRDGQLTRRVFSGVDRNQVDRITKRLVGEGINGPPTTERYAHLVNWLRHNLGLPPLKRTGGVWPQYLTPGETVPAAPSTSGGFMWPFQMPGK